MSISKFRLGNYAEFDGELQIITTQTGIDNSAFLDPLPITVEIFKKLDFPALEETQDYCIYLFKTSSIDGVSVVFNSKADKEYLIMEQLSRAEYPFIRWVHELQNLVEDKMRAPEYKTEPSRARRILVQ